MTTIQKALIANVYPHIDIDLLQEVIDATPNAEIATEILCGIYLEPKIPLKVWNDDKSKTYFMISFDKWKDTVSYEYRSPKQIRGHFLYAVDKKTITEENFGELSVPYDGDKTYSHSIYSTTQLEKHTSYTELKQWMKLHAKCPIDHFEPAADLAGDDNFEFKTAQLLEE